MCASKCVVINSDDVNVIYFEIGIDKLDFLCSMFSFRYFRHKILPQLITAYEYGDAGSAVLAPMFKVS